MGTQPSLPKKGHSSHQLFGPCLLWLNGLMDQDATWYGGRPWPRPHCVRWAPSSPQKKKKRRHSPLPIFGPRLLRPNSWMDQDATWYEGKPPPRPYFVRWGQAPSKNGAPIFGPRLLWPNGRPFQLLLALVLLGYCISQSSKRAHIKWIIIGLITKHVCCQLPDFNV